LTNTRWLTTTFLLLVAALCTGLAIVEAAISIATAPGFLQVLTTPYNQVQDYAFNLDHVDCRILIYGDSSAMTSDNPATIEARTHLKTCNISQTQPILSITGTLPVDVYLRRNRPPKYLVIQVAPDVFYKPHRLDQVMAFDPMTFMLRHHSGAETTREMLGYPLQTLQYVSLVLQARYKPDRNLVAAFKEAYRQPIANYYATRGLLTLPKPIQKECGPPEIPSVPADAGWLDEARRRYSALGVKVLVTVSPIPDCDTRLALYRQGISPHVDGGISTMPLAFFNDADRHYTREGAEVVSTTVAQRIVALEHQTNVAVR
jgi:hypothetical protein